MTEISIKYGEQSVTVFYNYPDGTFDEIAFVDKHTTAEDVAQAFYEVVAALNASVSMEEI